MPLGHRSKKSKYQFDKKKGWNGLSALTSRRRNIFNFIRTKYAAPKYYERR